MKPRRWRRHRQRDAAELNITAFMNLMVVLVPFLLITAVFSRLAVLELNLPASDSSEADAKPPQFQLEITVRDAEIDVGDRSAGVLNRFENSAGHYELAKLADYLKEVKRRFPEKTDATLLVEPDISYETLVAVMDVVRVVEQPGAGGRLVKAELFPEISIGDAPLAN